MNSQNQWVDVQRQFELLMLHNLPRFGYQRYIQQCSDSEFKSLTCCSVSQLQNRGFSLSQAKQLLCADYQRRVQALQNWHQPNHQQYIVTIEDDAYPALLKQISSPPLVLFAHGDITLLMRHQIAIVGCRSPSHYGRSAAYDMAEQLARKGIVITSGLALGIDACAHRGAMSVGNTIAVLGCGIDRIYPKRHSAIYEQMLSDGNLLISEFSPGTPAKAEHFPRRNRIVSGLSLGVLVIEAAIKSGSLITVRCALEQNREVFALPGNIHQIQSEGCHFLIQQGAKLVTCSEHILDEFQSLNLTQVPSSIEVGKKSPISPLATSRLLDSVDFDVTPIDIITERSELPVQEVLAALLEYELRGFVASTAGGYVKLRGK